MPDDRTEDREAAEEAVPGDRPEPVPDAGVFSADSALLGSRGFLKGGKSDSAPVTGVGGTESRDATEEFTSDREPLGVSSRSGDRSLLEREEPLARPEACLGLLLFGDGFLGGSAG